MFASHARLRAFAIAAIACAVAASPARAQQPQAQLSLEDAIALALRNNADHIAQRNRVTDADWSVREAYGGLLPSAHASTAVQYQGAGASRFGIFTAEDIGLGDPPAYYLSDYGLSLNYRLNGSTLFRPRRERSARDAAESHVDASRLLVAAEVTNRYIASVRARDGVALARQELERAAENAKLAEARVDVGAGIPLEAKQAEVERGRAEVALLQAETLQETEKLRLMQQIGVEIDRDVELTTRFEIFEPAWSRDALIARAVERHPQLRAARASEHSSEAGIRMARSAYLPTLDVTASWSGFTRQASDADFLVRQAQAQTNDQVASCQLLNAISAGLTEPLPGFPANCSAFAFSPDMEARIRESNDVFPFDYTRQPFSLRAQVSVPIFQGFSRQRQVEAARIAADDARHRLRTEELRLRTEITAALLNLRSAHQSVVLERRNSELADEQLRLARERYRVGAIPFLDLMDAETLKARADRAHLNAVYAFHEAFAALELAVGEPLR